MKKSRAISGLNARIVFRKPRIHVYRKPEVNKPESLPDNSELSGVQEVTATNQPNDNETKATLEKPPIDGIRILSKAANQAIFALVLAVILLATTSLYLASKYYATKKQLAEYTIAVIDVKKLTGKTISSTSRDEVANMVFTKFLKSGARPGPPVKSDYQIIIRSGEKPTLFVKDRFGNVILVKKLTDGEIAEAVDERIQALALMNESGKK